jgi:hypothetical protein
MNDTALKTWAEKVTAAERAFRHGKCMAEVKAALDGLSLFDLMAAAGGELPEAVTSLPQYDRIHRGVGEARGRTIELARDLLAEREADLETWLGWRVPAQRAEPELGQEEELPERVEPVQPDEPPFLESPLECLHEGDDIPDPGFEVPNCYVPGEGWVVL